MPAELLNLAAPPVPEHLPLQHPASVVHAWLSEVQRVPSHVPPTQLTEQQSVGEVHA